MTSPGRGRPIRGHAFGLTLASDFELEGLPPARGPSSLPTCTLSLVDEEALELMWPASGVTRVETEAHEDLVLQTVDMHPEAGFRLFARYFGRLVVAADGSRVSCAAPATAHWRWQRLLVGRGLPIASLLAGYELFHASAVLLDDRVVAISGPTGAGKTSLALHLALEDEGAFVTDDVLVIERDGPALLVHPGFPVTNVRSREEQLLDAPTRARIGTRMGSSGRAKAHYAIPRAEGRRPLGALFLLRGRAHGTARIERVLAPDPLTLLSSTFTSQIHDPARLARLLDVCHVMSTSVPIFDVTQGSREGAASLAHRLAEEVRVL